MVLKKEKETQSVQKCQSIYEFFPKYRSDEGRKKKNKKLPLRLTNMKTFCFYSALNFEKYVSNAIYYEPINRQSEFDLRLISLRKVFKQHLNRIAFHFFH